MDEVEKYISEGHVVDAIQKINAIYHTEWLFLVGEERFKLTNQLKKSMILILNIIIKDSDNCISFEDSIFPAELLKSMDLEKDYAQFMFSILKKFGGNSLEWKSIGIHLENHQLFEKAGECFFFAIRLEKVKDSTQKQKLENLIELWGYRARNYKHRNRIIDQEAADMMIDHLKNQLDEEIMNEQIKNEIEKEISHVLPKKIDMAYQQLFKKRENRIKGHNQTLFHNN